MRMNLFFVVLLCALALLHSIQYYKLRVSLWCIIVFFLTFVLGSLVTQLSDAMKTQHNQVQGFVADLKSMVGKGPRMDHTLQLLPLTATTIPRDQDSGNDGRANPTEINDELNKQTKEILAIMRKQEKKIDEEMKSIKEIVSVSRATDSEGNVVYVGPELKNLLENTEKISRPD